MVELVEVEHPLRQSLADSLGNLFLGISDNALNLLRRQVELVELTRHTVTVDVDVIERIVVMHAVASRVADQ